jgi:hypothetical protein
VGRIVCVLIAIGHFTAALGGDVELAAPFREVFAYELLTAAVVVCGINKVDARIEDGI